MDELEQLRNEIVKIFGEMQGEIIDLRTRLALLEDTAKRLPVVYNRLAMVNEVDRSFSNDELDNIAFDVGINGDGLVGKTKGQRVRDLIVQCERRGTTRQLISVCKKERPNGQWPDI